MVKHDSVGSAGLLYGRPEFESRLGTPGRFSRSAASNEELERGLGEWSWMNALYEYDYKMYETEKEEINN
jgi:hypothetical protein